MSSSSSDTSLSGYISWTSEKSCCEQSSPPEELDRVVKELDVAHKHEPNSPAIVLHGKVTNALCSLPTVTRQIRHESSHKPSPSSNGIITKSFLHGQSQWIDEPVISQWRNPSSKLLATLDDVDRLYHEWRQTEPAPFNPFLDRLWMQSAATLREAGLPWHNNNLNMPDAIDPR